jgi:hypothetical protein
MDRFSLSGRGAGRLVGSQQQTLALAEGFSLGLWTPRPSNYTSKRVQTANSIQTNPWRVGTLCMNPSFKVRGAVLVLHPFDMVSVALDQLGECVGSLAENGQVIVDALDELLTCSWQ